MTGNMTGQAYMTHTYKGHVIGLVNGSRNEGGKHVWGDYIEVDGKVYRDELFTSPTAAWNAAQHIVDEMEK